MFPSIVIIGGCIGVGKTTVGKMLSLKLAYDYFDGDDFHSAENKLKISQGESLTDENRIPWLEELSKFISQHENIVLSCSALKKMYRRILTGKLDNPEKCRIIMLQVPRSVLEERIRARTGHFANESILDTQLSTLQLPTDEVFTVIVDGNRPSEEVVGFILIEINCENLY